MKLNLIKSALAAIVYVVSSVTQAQANQVSVTLDPPAWAFKADTVIIPNHEARLAPQEQSLAEQLKPLLAKADYQGAANVLESYKNITKSAALWQLTGQVYVALEQYPKAEGALLTALKQAPGLSRSHRSLAVIHLQQKNYNKAHFHIGQAIALGHHDAQLFGQLAYINMQNQQPWAAVSGYQRALLLEPNNQQWQQGLMASLIQSQQFSAAHALVMDLIAEDETNANLWLRRGQIALNLQQFEQALSSFEMALRLGDTQVGNRLLTAQLHIQHGSVARASLLLKDVLRQDALQFSQLHSTFAWLLQHQHYDQAEQLLATIANVSALSVFDQSRYYAFKGQLASEKDSAKHALKWYEKSLSLDGNNGDVLLALAEHFSKRNAYSRAELYYIRAAVIGDVKEQALLGHAQLEINQQDYASAIVLLNKVLAHNPNRLDLKQNIAILQRLQNQAS